MAKEECIYFGFTDVVMLCSFFFTFFMFTSLLLLFLLSGFWFSAVAYSELRVTLFSYCSMFFTDV